MSYSDGVERALRAALAAHDGQLRKCADVVPYIVHPLHVSLMLARWGMDEPAIQAGVLHDVVEDCDDWTVERVREEFGVEVADIVDQLTEDKSRRWSERKQAAIDAVEHMSYYAAAVKAADKLHNLQSLLSELRSTRDPEAVWAQFTGGRERTLATAERLVAALERRLDPHIAEELRAVLEELKALDAAQR